MEKVEKPAEELKSIRLSFQGAPGGANEVVAADHLAKSFDGKLVFDKLSFLIKKGSASFCRPKRLRKIYADENHCGTELPDSGTVEIGANIKAAYYDQENQNLDARSTVLDELWNAYPRLTEYEIRRALALFLFDYEDTQKLVSALSGGERARLTFGKIDFIQSKSADFG